jgi:putative membrane protein
MLRFIFRCLSATAGIVVAGYLLPGVSVDDIWAAAMAALGLGLINATLRPILLLLTLPLTVLTLGGFALIVNGAMLALVASWVPGVHLAGFGSAVLGAIVISLVAGLVNWVLRPAA